MACWPRCPRLENHLREYPQIYGRLLNWFSPHFGPASASPRQLLPSARQVASAAYVAHSGAVVRPIVRCADAARGEKRLLPYCRFPPILGTSSTENLGAGFFLALFLPLSLSSSCVPWVTTPHTVLPRKALSPRSLSTSRTGGLHHPLAIPRSIRIFFFVCGAHRLLI